MNKKTNKQSKNRLIDTENRVASIRGDGGLGLSEKIKKLKEKC